MLLMADEDTFETFLGSLPAEVDRPTARQAHREILGIATGDPTPAPGTLMRATLEPVADTLFVPPQHEGWDMPPDGKFYTRGAGKTFTFRALVRSHRRERRWRRALVVFDLVVFAALIDIAVHWR